MGKLRSVLSFFLLVVLGGSSMSAQEVKLSDILDNLPWAKRLVDEVAPVTFDLIIHGPASTDFATNAALVAAMGLQESIEGRTNLLTDSLVKTQMRTGVMTTSMYAVQKSYEKAQTNTSEFEEGTDFYDYVMDEVNSIVAKGNELERIIRRSKLSQKQECIEEVGRFKEVARGLIDNYIDVVTNGKAENPNSLSAGAGSKDGYNAMTRLERLDAAKTIAGQLKQLEMAIDYMSRALLACESFDNVGAKRETDLPLAASNNH